MGIVGVIEDGYKPSEKEPFMNERQKEYFRRKLTAWRESILAESKETLAALQNESENHPDIADRASSETDRAIELRARDRQRKLIAKIEAALARIDDGNLRLLHRNRRSDLASATRCAADRDAVGRGAGAPRTARDESYRDEYTGAGQPPPPEQTRHFRFQRFEIGERIVGLRLAARRRLRRRRRRDRLGGAAGGSRRGAIGAGGGRRGGAAGGAAGGSGGGGERTSCAPGLAGRRRSAAAAAAAHRARARGAAATGGRRRRAWRGGGGRRRRRYVGHRRASRRAARRARRAPGFAGGGVGPGGGLAGGATAGSARGGGGLRPGGPAGSTAAAGGRARGPAFAGADRTAGARGAAAGPRAYHRRLDARRRGAARRRRRCGGSDARRRRLDPLGSRGAAATARTICDSTHVVRAADHDQMFDIVAPHQHQLALSVERKGVDQAESRLARAAAAGNAQAMAENEAINDDKDQRRPPRPERRSWRS